MCRVVPQVERVAWWPGLTEEGKKTMTHFREYSEALRNVQVRQPARDIKRLVFYT